MGNGAEKLIDESSLEVIKSLTDTKRELIKLLSSTELADEFKRAILDHVIRIDNTLISGIKDIIPAIIYDDIKKTMKKQNKRIEEIEKKTEGK